MSIKKVPENRMFTCDRCGYAVEIGPRCPHPMYWGTVHDPILGLTADLCDACMGPIRKWLLEDV